MNRISFILKLSLFISLLIVTPALAATIRVPADQPTIQAGIDAVVDGDFVLVAPGTYVENIDFLGKAITLQSEQVADVTVIDGNQNGSVVTFSSGETEETAIDGFTIRNGNGTFCSKDYTNGGGIYCTYSSPMIMNCVITDNNISSGRPRGGGIYCDYSSPTIENCTIIGNIATDRADGYGGGIAFYHSKTPKFGVKYAMKVYDTLDKKGLLIKE